MMLKAVFDTEVASEVIASGQGTVHARVDMERWPRPKPLPLPIAASEHINHIITTHTS